MSANLWRSSSMNRLPKPQPPMSLQLKILVVAVLVGFGILHLIGGTMMQRASGKPSTDAAMLTPTGD